MRLLWLVAVILLGRVGGTVAAAAEVDGPPLKWHPGHYMGLLARHRQPVVEFPYIDAIGEEPTLQGVLVVWLWSDIEREPGRYDFSSIDQYLGRLKAQPGRKRLIIRIEDRGYSSPTITTVPDYLKTDPAYHGGEVPMANGVVARIWEAPVMDRLVALYRALARRYDGDPAVEGISTNETAIGFTAEHPAPDTFSSGALLTQLERLTAAAREDWAHSNVFVLTNYLGSDAQMEQLIRHSMAHRLAVGGPDTWSRAWVFSGKRALQSDEIVRGVRGSRTDYRGVVAIANEVESTELGGYIADFTPAEVFDTAVHIMHANYIVWDRNTFYGGPAQKWNTGILPFIKSVRGKTVTACPTSFRTGCMRR